VVSWLLTTNKLKLCNSLFFDHFPHFLDTALSVRLTLLVEVDPDSLLLELFVCVEAIFNKLMLQFGQELTRGGSLSYLSFGARFLNQDIVILNIDRLMDMKRVATTVVLLWCYNRLERSRLLSLRGF
jgi:hypothetical protein